LIAHIGFRVVRDVTAIDELLNSIFPNKHIPFKSDFENWLRRSRRFQSFAAQYRTKMRAKLNNVRDEAGLQDLRAEWEVAFIILQDERFTLEYETYLAAKQRGPDYTAAFRTNTRLNIEVRRIRGLELDHANPDVLIHKLMAVICDKVRQMPPGMINLLWLTAESDLKPDDLNHAAVTLRQMAGLKTHDFFARRGFTDAAEFLKYYRQLSGIILYHPQNTTLWPNPLTRHSIPRELVNAFQRINLA